MSRAFCFLGPARPAPPSINPDRLATIERDVLIKRTLSGIGMLTGNYKGPVGWLSQKGGEAPPCRHP